MSDSPKHPSWIVAHDGTGGADAYAVECRRCGAVQRFSTPIAVSVWVAAVRAFERTHRHCTERTSDSR